MLTPCIAGRRIQIFAIVIAVLISSECNLARAVVYDFDANDGGFVVTTPIPFDGPWVYSPGTGSWRTDGQGPENQHANTTDLTSPALVMSTASQVFLSFDHRYSFESGDWDGGAVFVSLNGGPFTYLAGSTFTSNGYNGTVLANSVSQLHGQQAFVSDSPGHNLSSYITSVADLGSFAAGNNIQVLFRAAYDTNTRGISPNWELQKVSLSVQVIPEPPGVLLIAIGVCALALRARR
jgi:hypothetical protein